MEIDLGKQSFSKTTSYKLSALLDVDSFFYALFDSSTETLIKHGRQDLTRPASDMYSDKTDVSSTCCAVWTGEYTLIPDEEYHEDHLATYVGSNSSRLDFSSFDYKSDPVTGLGMHVCYAVPHKQMALIKEHLGYDEVVHFLSALSGDLSRREKKSILICSVEKRSILLAISGAKVYGCLSLRETNPVSLLYYISLIQETYPQMKDAEVELSGDLDKNDQAYKLISKYHKTSILEDHHHLKVIGRCAS